MRKNCKLKHGAKYHMMAGAGKPPGDDPSTFVEEGSRELKSMFLDVVKRDGKLKKITPANSNPKYYESSVRVKY